MWTALGRSIGPCSERAAGRTRMFFSLAHQTAAPCSTPRGERASMCRGAPRPDTTRRPRRAERGNGAARQRGGSAATRRPARVSGLDEHGEHPPVAAVEHRGTSPVSRWHRRFPHNAAASRARPAADDHGAQAVLVSDMARHLQRPRLAQCADLRWKTPVSRALMFGLLRGACRWPSWVCACMPGTILYGVLVARNCYRYRLDCLDHSLSLHVDQRLLPKPPDLRPPPTSRVGASRYGGRSRPDTPFAW